MTAIAIKDGVVASDSMQVDYFIGQVNAVKTKKLKRISDGQTVIVGGTGTFSEVHWFMDWVEYSCSKEDYINSNDRDSTLFVVDSEGVWKYDTYYKPIYSGKMSAFGSGAQFAMGAMMAGATAEEAVRIAIELDTNSGRDVVTLRLED